MNSDDCSAIPLLGTVALNGGDAAIATGAIQFLERATARPVVILDRDAADVSRLYPSWTVSPWATFASIGRSRTWLGRALERIDRLRRSPVIGRGNRRMARIFLTSAEKQVADLIRTAPLVAATGGTYLVDHYRWQVRVPELELAARAGRPLVFLTQSMGPFVAGHRGHRRLGRLLEEALLVMARDEPTVAAINSLAPHCHPIVAPDMAFAMAWNPAVERATRPYASVGNRPRVAVSVRSWPYLEGGPTAVERYRRELLEMVTTLVRRHGATVTFASTCQGVPAYRFDDSEEALLIVKGLDPDVRHSVFVDRDHHVPHSFIRLMSQFDVLVGTRMHASIMAWIAGTPSVGIAYEPKTRELFSRLGDEHLVWDMNRLVGTELAASVVAIVESAEEARDRVTSFVSAEADQLLQLSRTFGAELISGW